MNKIHKKNIDNWYSDYNALIAVFVLVFMISAVAKTDYGLEQLFLFSIRITTWIFVTIGWITILVKLYKKIRKRNEMQK